MCYKVYALKHFLDTEFEHVVYGSSTSASPCVNPSPLMHSSRCAYPAQNSYTSPSRNSLNAIYLVIIENSDSECSASWFWLTKTFFGFRNRIRQAQPAVAQPPELPERLGELIDGFLFRQQQQPLRHVDVQHSSHVRDDVAAEQAR